MSNENKIDEDLMKFFREPITAQERAFCLEYVIDYNLSRASKECNLSVSKAKAILRKPSVQEFLAELQNQVFNRKFITEDWVLQQGMELFLKVTGEQDIPCGRKENGEVYYTRKFYAETSVKLWNEFAKMTKLYEEGSDAGDKAINSLADAFRSVLGKGK